MPESLRRTLSAAAAWFGVDLVQHQSLRHPVGRRTRFLHSLGVDLVVDVGANEGQYARELRAFGYAGRITSIEPLLAPYEILAAAAANDPNWHIIRAAAGAADAHMEMLVAANRGASSSLLPMLPLHEVNAPDARIVGHEFVHVRRLDDLLAGEIEAAERPFLKIDVQGYEFQVLEGAERTLPHFIGLQIELQLFPVYRGAPTFLQMLDRLSALDLVLAGLEPGFCALDGYLLQADGIFVKRSLVPSP